MNNKQLIGKRIKEIRKNRNFTQEQLAEAVGIDVTTLSGIESGRHFPSLVTLEKIAKVLDVSLVNLFDYNHFLSTEEMKSVIADNLNLLSSDDIKFVYRLLNKKYMSDI